MNKRRPTRDKTSCEKRYLRYFLLVLSHLAIAPVTGCSDQQLVDQSDWTSTNVFTDDDKTTTSIVPIADKQTKATSEKPTSTAAKYDNSTELVAQVDSEETEPDGSTEEVTQQVDSTTASSDEANVPPTFMGDGAFASPTGTGTTCSIDDPCDWKTAISSSKDTVVLLDGVYVLSEVWTIPAEKTVTAHHKWAAKIEGTGFREYFFNVYGTLKHVEITAPESWSVIELREHAVADGIFLHDANTLPGKPYPGGSVPSHCVQQGAIDTEPHSQVINSVIYNTGLRDGADRCNVYHPIYYTHHNVLRNNLIFHHMGGWCIHAWQAFNINNDISQNTTISCDNEGIIAWGHDTNIVEHNVVTQSRGCINIYGGADSLSGFNNICTDTSHTTGVGATTDGDIGPAEVPVQTIVVDFENATTAQEKIRVAKRYSMDHALTNGAGYIYVD